MLACAVLQMEACQDGPLGQGWRACAAAVQCALGGARSRGRRSGWGEPFLTAASRHWPRCLTISRNC